MTASARSMIVILINPFLVPFPAKLPSMPPFEDVDHGSLCEPYWWTSMSKNPFEEANPNNLKTSASGFWRAFFSPRLGSQLRKAMHWCWNFWNEPTGDHVASWMHGGKFHPIPRARNALTPRNHYTPSELLHPSACFSWLPSPGVGKGIF